MSRDTLGAIALFALVAGLVWLSSVTGAGRASKADIHRVERQIEERCR